MAFPKNLHEHVDKSRMGGSAKANVTGTRTGKPGTSQGDGGTTMYNELAPGVGTKGSRPGAH